MTEITSAQRKALRSMAHHLKPVVYVGKQGVGDALIGAVDDALDAHELIKIKFNDFKDEKQELMNRIAEATDSTIAGIIGHIAILYREHRDPEKREIRLPN